MKTDNELIAIFMGAHQQIIGDEKKYGYEPGTILWWNLFDDDGGPMRHLDYDNSWDWLMPVVTKIERLGYTVYIFANFCKIWPVIADVNKDQPLVYSWSGNIDDSEKILGVYDAVTTFIKWYNEKV